MSLYQRIQANLNQLSPAMKKIADYFLSHFDDLPFESAEHIAAAVGVSSISVGRYLRQLGFQNMDDFRLALKSQMQARWQLTDRLEAHIQRSPQNDIDNECLQKEIQQLQKTHALRDSVVYQNILKHLLQADSVHIIGLQSCRGLMLYFYSLLEYLRPNVYYSDGGSGAFVDVFNQNAGYPYLFFADTRHYAVQSQRICQAAQEHQMDYAFITDVYCPWAATLSGDIIQVETDIQQFWDSALPFVSLFQSLLNDIARTAHPDMQARIRQNKALQDYFKQFED